MSRTRTLSYTEINTALTCWARLRWDFSYGGHLAGAALKPRQTAPILSGGRAWGAAVAVWHASADSVLAPHNAHGALIDSLDADVVEQRELGFTVDPEQAFDQREGLAEILDHYMRTASPMPGLARLEEEINVPLRARGDSRHTSRLYRYQAHIDGHYEADHPWIVDFKLRGQLTSVEVIERQPQYRWYAWARAQQLGWPGAVGVLIDERLNAAPKPARLVKAKRKGEGVDGLTVSHAVDQLTTVERYCDACAEYGVDRDPDTVKALSARVWQHRVPLIFTPHELTEAGRELTSVAQTIRDLDSGRLYPIRHGSTMNCSPCRFKSICLDPENDFVVDSLYERRPAKRDRGMESAAV